MKLIGKLLLLFTVSSFVEIFLLVQLTRYTSIWVTIALSLTSGLLGPYLAKREGTRTWAQIRAAMRLEQEPTSAVLDGAMFLVAAAFLIAPGILTDIVGLSLLIPAVRRPVGQYLKRRAMKALDRQLSGSVFQLFTSGGGDSNLAGDAFSQPKRENIFSRTERERGRGPIIDIDPEK